MHSSGWRVCFWQWDNLPFLFQKNYLMNYPINCSNGPFQDTKFNPPSLDRKGHPIDYQPPCPVSRIGSAAPPLKKLMKTHAASTIVTYQSSKCKAAQGTTQKTVTGKRLRRTRPSTAQVKQLPLISKWYSTSNLVPFTTVINYCILICSGCGTVVLGIQVSINWTFIGWSSKGADFGWNNRCF